MNDTERRKLTNHWHRKKDPEIKKLIVAETARRKKIRMLGNEGKI